MLQTTKIILIFDISSNTATVLILRGSLLPSSHIICGTTYAKVRQLIDSNGKQLKQAGPGDAVIVSGWKDLPRAGDEVLQGEEDDVKKAVQNRLRRVQLNATLHDAEAINAQRRSERERKEEESNQASTILNALPQPDTRQLRLVLKTDVSGSAEAITTAAESIGNKLVGTKVVTSGVGEVTESDVAMAKAIGGEGSFHHSGSCHCHDILFKHNSNTCFVQQALSLLSTHQCRVLQNSPHLNLALRS